MALYKDFQIDGGIVTMNMDNGTAVVHTSDAVWFGVTEMPIKISIKDGEPVAEFIKSKSKSDVQTVSVNLTGDQWLVDMAGDVIDQIAEQTKGSRVVINRDK